MEKIIKYVPQGVRLIPQGEYVAASLQNYLHRHPEMDERCTRGGKCHYLTTENSEKFHESAALFMHESTLSVEKINL